MTAPLRSSAMRRAYAGCPVMAAIGSSRRRRSSTHTSQRRAGAAAGLHAGAVEGVEAVGDGGRGAAIGVIGLHAAHAGRAGHPAPALLLHLQRHVQPPHVCCHGLHNTQSLGCLGLSSQRGIFDGLASLLLPSFSTSSATQLSSSLSPLTAPCLPIQLLEVQRDNLSMI